MSASRQRTSTAMLVAAGLLLESSARATEQDALSLQLARAGLQACGALGRRLLALLDCAPGRWLLRTAQALLLPGIAAHYRWRKRRIARWVDAEIRAGARQLVVVGAGFDALASSMLRMHPQLHAVELDLPAHQSAKRAALAQVEPGQARLSLRSIDLAVDDIALALSGVDGFDPALPTCVVAEGVLMYLPPASVARLFAGLRRLSGGAARVIATAMDVDARGRPGFRARRGWVDAWLRQRDEPFLWGSSRQRLPETLRALGLQPDDVATHDDPGDPDPCPGEWLFRGRPVAAISEL